MFPLFSFGSLGIPFSLFAYLGLASPFSPIIFYLKYLAWFYIPGYTLTDSFLLALSVSEVILGIEVFTQTTQFIVYPTLNLDVDKEQYILISLNHAIHGEHVNIM